MRQDPGEWVAEFNAQLLGLDMLRERSLVNLADLLTARGMEAGLSRRDGRIVACEAIGGALALLHRLNHVWCDTDVRETLMQVRAALSVAQSKIKERIEL